MIIYPMPLHGMCLCHWLLLPLVLLLWPFAWWNFYQRAYRGARDEWYWADKTAMRCGWYFMLRFV